MLTEYNICSLLRVSRKWPSALGFTHYIQCHLTLKKEKVHHSTPFNSFDIQLSWQQDCSTGPCNWNATGRSCGDFGSLGGEYSLIWFVTARSCAFRVRVCFVSVHTSTFCVENLYADVPICIDTNRRYMHRLDYLMDMGDFANWHDTSCIFLISFHRRAGSPMAWEPNNNL